MANEPGKYDDECLAAMQACGAVTTILIVLGGNKGSGFSVTSLDPRVQQTVPKWLRRVADSIEGS